MTDTFAPSYLHLAVREAGAVATAVEERKKIKYSNLTSSYCFTPVAVETSGALGPATMNFIKDLGCRLTQATEEEATVRLLQRLSVSVQLGNAACLCYGYTLGSIPHLLLADSFWCFFFVFFVCFVVLLWPVLLSHLFFSFFSYILVYFLIVY